MAKAKGNSFEARDKKARKRSSIIKMSELRDETIQAIPKVVESTEVPKKIAEIQETKIDEPIKDSVIISENIDENIADKFEKIDDNKEENNTNKEIESEKKITGDIELEVINKQDTVVHNEVKLDEDFFNLNIKNDVFEGKITTVRVYDDILETLKKYASMKNYPIIEFTNKVITLGLDDLDNYDMLKISEIKFKNNTSRSIMYNLTDTMEEKLNKYIKIMSKKGYKISRNVILNVILNETLKKFYI